MQASYNLCIGEYEYHDGETRVTLFLRHFDSKKMTAEIAVQNRGRITIQEIYLLNDTEGNLYFEFGENWDKIYIDDFI